MPCAWQIRRTLVASRRSQPSLLSRLFASCALARLEALPRDRLLHLCQNAKLPTRWRRPTRPPYGPPLGSPGRADGRMLPVVAAWEPRQGRASTTSPSRRTTLLILSSLREYAPFARWLVLLLAFVLGCGSEAVLLDMYMRNILHNIYVAVYIPSAYTYLHFMCAHILVRLYRNTMILIQ